MDAAALIGTHRQAVHAPERGAPCGDALHVEAAVTESRVRPRHDRSAHSVWDDLGSDLIAQCRAQGETIVGPARGRMLRAPGADTRQEHGNGGIREVGNREMFHRMT